MKVTLITSTPNPEKSIACAAKLCYANSSIDVLYDGLTDEKSADFVEMLAGLGHESPIEHVSFTFGIEGISRACSHQLVRHRIASFSQQSQRYVDMDNFEYIIPPEIQKSGEAKKVFIQAMEAALNSYKLLSDKLSEEYYQVYLTEGQSENVAKISAQKKAQEDARFVLPNACETKLIVTMNARGLLNFFKHRCCNRAQWEIKAVADEMLKLVCELAPTLFSSAGPSCYKKTCTEGKMTCGQSAQMRAFYAALHEAAKNKETAK